MAEKALDETVAAFNVRSNREDVLRCLKKIKTSLIYIYSCYTNGSESLTWPFGNAVIVFEQPI